MNKFLLFTFLILGSACPGFGSEGAEVIKDVPTFEKEIKPIFDRLCNECHGATPSKGGEFFPIRYDVCKDEDLGGKATQGAQAISDKTKNRMIDQGNMPPATYSAQATPDDIALVQRWIDEGSPCDTSEVKSTTGTNSGTTEPTPEFSEVADILRRGCTDENSSCHQNDAGGLQISKTDTNAMVAAELQGNNLKDVAFVTENNPAASRLYIRMSDAMNPMPPSGLLDSSVTDKIKAWIQAGAKY